MDCKYIELRSAREAVGADFAKLQEDSFWSNGSDSELRIHRIHAYPAKFPAFITTKALAYAQSNGVNVRRVADVFCGCGTVAFEARRNGIDFWGCDINPVATLIARTKSGTFDEARLAEYFEGIQAKVTRASAKVDLSASAVERLNYWYSDD